MMKTSGTGTRSRSQPGSEIWVRGVVTDAEYVAHGWFPRRSGKERCQGCGTVVLIDRLLILGGGIDPHSSDQQEPPDVGGGHDLIVERVRNASGYPGLCRSPRELFVPVALRAD